MNCKRLLSVLVGSGLAMALGVRAAESPATPDAEARALRAQPLRGVRATYCAPPQLDKKRANIALLIQQLVEIHANTYSFCIHSSSNNWDDLQLFLPEARKHGIRVWGSVVPPSESPPHATLYAEPFRLDYKRWAVEFAKLSLRETNLVAWSIDDFTHNLKTTFTPEYVKQMLEASHAINPRLAFVPCCYYKSITPEFVKDYEPLLDGFLFPYRHESGGANLKQADLTAPEVKTIKALTGADFPVIVDVYASAHSSLGKTTPDYVREVMVAGKNSADGVMVYRHQDPILYPEKYQIVKELFTAWSDNEGKGSR